MSARVNRVALITGVGGQDGVYLARSLRSRGYQVVGTVPPAGLRPLRLAPYLHGVEIVEVDVSDGESMCRLLLDHRPVEVYNLAAMSSVATSWTVAERVAEVNGVAVLRLMESVLRYREIAGEAPRVFQASSSEVFDSATAPPFDEHSPHRPRSPYGAAKSFADHVVAGYRESYGLFACSGILFNHESPLRPASFVTRKIARAAAEISQGVHRRLALGNLDVRRDWGAASDFVEAMWLMLQQPVAADYVIATGAVSSLRDVVETAFDSVGIGRPWTYVDVDPDLVRAAEATQAWGDPALAKQELGWAASTSMAEVIDQMVAVDVARLRGGVEESADLLGWPDAA